jgi:hypothetical protein
MPALYEKVEKEEIENSIGALQRAEMLVSELPNGSRLSSSPTIPSAPDAG